MQLLSGRIKSLFVVGGLILVLSRATWADIVKVGGAAALVEPPPSILVDQWESNTEIRGWFERQAALTSSLLLDHVDSGAVNNEPLLVPGAVPSGTTVRSYMFFADSVGEIPALLSGFVIFEEPILGVLVLGESLNSTDALLSRPGVIYGQQGTRELELDTTHDSFEISADRFRLDFTLRFGFANDNLRVVTAVPEPGACSLLTMAGLAVLGRRARKQTRQALHNHSAA